MYKVSTRGAEESLSRENGGTEWGGKLKAFARSEERCRLLLEWSFDALCLLARDGTLLETNPAYRRMFDLPPDALNNAGASGHCQDSLDPSEFLARVDREGFVTESDVRLRKADGTVVRCARASVAIRDDSGKLVAVQCVIRNETERYRTRQELKSTKELLHQLANRAEEAREEERIGIARELHDQVGQALTAIKMSLARQDSPDEAVRIERKKETIKLVNQTIDDVRRISSDLRPGILDDLGFVPAAEWLVADVGRRSGIDCRFSAENNVEALGKKESTVLFRVLQELLTNVLRHANATSVNVEFWSNNNDFVMCVQDNGRGITTKEVEDTTSIGLLGIRERLWSVAGEVTLEGKHGKGTSASVRVPHTQHPSPSERHA